MNFINVKKHPCFIEVINNDVYLIDDLLGTVALGSYSKEINEHIEENYLEDISFIYEEYGQAKDSTLTEDAQELKKRIKEYITITDYPLEEN